MKFAKLSLFLWAISIVCSAQTFNEILGRPTNNSITVSVLFDTPVDTYIEYSATTGSYNLSTPISTTEVDIPAEIVLSGLQPETRYYYRTRYRKVGTATFLAGPERTFITQRNKGSKFVFTIEADPHPYDPKGYHPLWDICLRNQLNDGADFMLDLGDTHGDDHIAATITSAQTKTLLKNNRPFFGAVCHSMPLYFCLGNHEGESGYYLLQTAPNNIATYETLWRKTYYPNPYPDNFYTGNSEVEGNGMGNPENYYAWEWGDALFVVLDGWRYNTTSVKPRNWEWTFGKTQYEWLKKTLETSSAKYKFVFTHHVLGETRGGINIAKTFEWGGLDNGNNKFALNRAGWAMPIHQLMVQNHVNVYFQGHDHVYAREEMDNLVYQTVPMPSDSSYSLGYIANGAAFNGTVLKGSGHIRVTVSTDSLKIDFVSALLPKDETATSKNGQVLYSYGVKRLANSIATTYTQPDWSVIPDTKNNSLFVHLNEATSENMLFQLIGIDGKIILQQSLYSSDTSISLPAHTQGFFIATLKIGNRTEEVKKVFL